MIRYKHLTLLILIVILAISCASKISNVSGKQFELNEQPNHMSDVFFSVDSKQLIGSVDSGFPNFHGSIRSWNVEDGNLEKIIYKSGYVDGEYQRVNRLKLSNNGKMLAFVEPLNSLGSYSFRSNTMLWRDTWKKRRVWQGIQDISFMPDDSMIIAAGKRKVVTYDAKSGNILNSRTKFMEKYPLSLDRNLGIVISPNSRYIVIWYKPLFGGCCLSN